MATPTGPERRFLAAGLKKGAVWGTAVTLGAGNGLNCKAMSGFNPSRDLLVAEEVDSPLPKSGALNVYKPVDFSVVSDFLYSPGALGVGVASLFGVAGEPETVDTTGKKHTFQWGDGISGKFVTVDVEFPGKIYECKSGKVMEWDIKCASGGFLQSELKLRGNKIVDDSGVNGDTQMDALTYDERDNYVRFEEVEVMMNAESDDELGSSDKIYVSEFEVSYKRQGFDTVYQSGKDYIEEPAEGGYPEIKIKLKFPHFGADNKEYLAKAVAGQTQKMMIKFMSSALAGSATEPYSLTLYFPRLRVLMPEASWDEIVSLGLELVAEESGSAPTGMSYSRPYVELVNKRSGDYLG